MTSPMEEVGSAPAGAVGPMDQRSSADPRTTSVARDLTRQLALLGATSVVGGLAVALGARGDSITARGVRAFGRQTAGWGAVNVVIAGVAQARGGAPERSRLRSVLLVNAALDAAYMAAGGHVAFHRTTFGGRVAPEAARGHGLAVVVQGACLLGLDLGHARRLRTPE